MPVNKQQERRLSLLTEMLLDNRKKSDKNVGFTPVRYGTFLEKMRDLEIDDDYMISSKTFNRDIKTLQETQGAPLKYDHKRGWVLTGPWTPNNLWGAFDVRKALLSERISGSILPGKMQKELQTALGDLLADNAEHIAANLELENFQVLTPNNKFVDGEIFLKVYKAWESRKRLVINYRDRNGTCKEKTFEPHVFAWYNNVWYIKGKLLKNRTSLAEVIKDPPEIQVLALHRMLKVDIDAGISFKTDPKILAQVKKDGLFNFKRMPVVEMEFFGNSLKSMEERFEKQPELVTHRTSDLLRVKLKNMAEHEALSLAFSALGDVRIISPADLRDRMKEIAEQLVKNHTDQ